MFISHATADQKVASELCEAIERRGIRCWIAPRDIPAGMDWADAIIAALDGCSAVVVLLSPAANHSTNVGREIAYVAGNQGLVIPVRLANVRPSRSIGYFLGNIQWVDAFRSPRSSCVDQVIDALGRSETPIEQDWNQFDVTIPILTTLDRERRDLRRFLLWAAMPLSGLMVPVGAISLALGRTWPGVTLILLAAGCLPPLWGLYARLQACSDNVKYFVAAVEGRNVVAARRAMSRLVCFPNIQEWVDAP